MATPKSLSTIKSFRILGAFRRRDETLTNAQVSRRAGLPASSVRRLLLTLTEIGAIEHAGSIRYRLGPLLHALSHQVHVRDCLAQAGREALAGLSAHLGLPAAIGMLDHHMLTYVAAVAPPGADAALPGAQYEAYSSAIGKVLLAALPPEQLDRFLRAGDLVALTPFTITDAGALRAELEKIRRCGFAVECEETRLGTGCVAVPVTDGNGRVHAAMSVSDAAYKLTVARTGVLSDALAVAASAVQRQLFPSCRPPEAAAAMPVRGPLPSSGRAPSRAAEPQARWEN